MEREDLTFATCHQLAGLVEDDWDSARAKEEVERALKVMHLLEDPDSNLDSKVANITLMKLGVEAFKCVLANSDEWKTETADMLKKELVCRARHYERRINQLSSPLIDIGNIEFVA